MFYYLSHSSSYNSTSRFRYKEIGLSLYDLKVFSVEGNGKVFLWINSTYSVPMILVFSGLENERVYLTNFFHHPKKILIPADLNLLLSGKTLAILVSSSFHVYSYIYWSTVPLMMMEQNWVCESGFNVIICSEPYWSYLSWFFCLPVEYFVLAKNFSALGDRRVAGLLFTRNDQFPG